MEIPLTLFGVFTGGLLGAYITILYRVFQFSKDLEIDFNVTVQNLKNRELTKMKEFLEIELNEVSPDTNNVQDRIKKLMEERWKNAYSCYKSEDLIDNLNRRESAGQIWCIIGIISVVLAFVIYILPWVSVNIKIYPILVLWFLPLVAIALLFGKNVIIRRNIRDLKKEIEKIWLF